MPPDSTPEFVHVTTPGDHYSPSTGSATMTVIYELARRRDARGDRTRVVVGRDTRHDYPVGQIQEVDFGAFPVGRQRLVDAGLGMVGAPRLLTRRAYAAAAEAASGWDDPTIFLHNAPAAAGMFRRATSTARVCLYAHNDLLRSYTKREARKALSANDRVICVSDAIAQGIRDRAGNVDNLRVVRNGVDPDTFRPAVDRPEGIPVVLFLGRVVPMKGVDMLVRAAARIYSGSRRFKLRVVGSSGFSATDPLTAYEHELRAAAGPLGNDAEFVPFVDRSRVVAEYQRATIFSVPSRFDPCPLTLLEGLACGLPTIAARRGGIPEIGGDAALYFDPPNEDRLAELLADLLDDVSARQERATAARRQACRQTWEHAYQRLLAALSE